MKENITIDPDEIAHFTAMADEWWDADGKFRPLHQMNPTRLRYLRDRIAAHFGRDGESDSPFSGLSVVDIGSGGGLICEPLARLGAEVTGIDAAEKNIAIASLHAGEGGLTINYQHKTAETLAEEGKRFDVVLALEIIEHVADVDAFLSAVCALAKPGGLIFVSTLNRTAKSYAMAIVGAEYILRWLPRGTHHWHKFLKPAEIILPLAQYGAETQNVTGLAYHPLSGAWRLDEKQLDVNYILTAQKIA